MIALIAFEDELVLEREEAHRLNLNYTEGKFGYNNYYAKLKRMMHSYEYYIDELTLSLEGEKEVYLNKKGDKVEHYYIFERVENKDLVYIAKEGHLVDLEAFILLNPPKFWVVQAIKEKEPSIQNIQSLLYTIEEKTKVIDNTLEIMKSHTFNQKCNVHVGGGLIATYNDLALKEDCCTDALQVELNNGWRIIAVCAQPDQRRPDYILGRYNPKLEVMDKEQAGR